jgi:SAM-dependent methyltransferase
MTIAARTSEPRTMTYSFPPPAGFDAAPQWTGSGFRLGGETVSVLEYSENCEGWSDDLTTLHEENAGDSHPIDLASRSDALDQLSSHFRSSDAFTLLEVGCSSGFMLRAMAKRFPAATIIGSDVVRGPLGALAEKVPYIPLLRFDLVCCPLESQSCDAVVMLNVLEHIADDAAALSQVHRILRPGGIAVIEVPAGPHLFDAYDKALKHFRRYRIGELTDKMRMAGFRVERKSHLGFFLYPAFAWTKHRNQRVIYDSEDLTVVVKSQASDSSKSKLLSLAVRLERALGKWVSYPTGIRCLAVGRRD